MSIYDDEWIKQMQKNALDHAGLFHERWTNGLDRGSDRVLDIAANVHTVNSTADDTLTMDKLQKAVDELKELPPFEQPPLVITRCSCGYDIKIDSHNKAEAGAKFFRVSQHLIVGLCPRCAKLHDNKKKYKEGK